MGYLYVFYKQERSCLMHFVRLLEDEESARDILASNFAKYSLIKIFFHCQTQQ